MAREEANFRAAMRWAVDAGAYDVAVSMGHTFRDYLERSGRVRDFSKAVSISEIISK